MKKSKLALSVGRYATFLLSASETSKKKDLPMSLSAVNLFRSLTQPLPPIMNYWGNRDCAYEVTNSSTVSRVLYCWRPTVSRRNLPISLSPSLSAAAAVFAAYKLASSWALPMFFLYLIRLLPNQLETYRHTNRTYVTSFTRPPTAPFKQKPPVKFVHCALHSISTPITFWPITKKKSE